MKCQGFAGPCQNQNATKNRQNTNYQPDDAMNFKILCPECQEEADTFWHGQWADYYRNCMC